MMFRKKKETKVALNQNQCSQTQQTPPAQTWEELLLRDLRNERDGEISQVAHYRERIEEAHKRIAELDRRIATVEQLMKIRQVAATLKPLFKQAAAAVENL